MPGAAAISGRWGWEHDRYLVCDTDRREPQARLHNVTQNTSTRMQGGPPTFVTLQLEGHWPREHRLDSSQPSPSRQNKHSNTNLFTLAKGLWLMPSRTYPPMRQVCRYP